MKRYLAIFLLIASAAIASPAIAPAPKYQFLDNSGKPLGGGRIYFYTAGTTTKKDTYTDSNGLWPNKNPMILDSSGRANIWLNGSYKVMVNSASNTTLYTVDNLSMLPYTIDVFSQWIEASGTFSRLSNSSFSVAGDQTATFVPGTRLKTIDNGGNDYSTVKTSSYSGSSYTTTITVTMDSGSIDSGLKHVYTGIITISNPSLPIPATVSKVTDYTITVSDVIKSNPFVYNNLNAGNITIPAANAVPTGSKMHLHAAQNTVTVYGVIGGYTNPIMRRKQTYRLFSDGNLWHGDSTVGLGTTGFAGMTAFSCGSINHAGSTQYAGCGNILYDTHSPFMYDNSSVANMKFFRVPPAYSYFRICSHMGMLVNTDATYASANWYAEGSASNTLLQDIYFSEASVNNSLAPTPVQVVGFDNCTSMLPMSAYASSNIYMTIDTAHGARTGLGAPNNTQYIMIQLYE